MKKHIGNASKEIIARVILNYEDSGMLAADFASLDPRDRISVAVKMLSMVIPKDVNLTSGESETETLDVKLKRLAYNK